MMFYSLPEDLTGNRRVEKKSLLPFTKSFHLHPSTPSRFSSKLLQARLLPTLIFKKSKTTVT